MTDILLTWDNALGRGDWSIAGGDLVTSATVEDGDLQSAVLVSLFTHLGSWWGDSYSDTPTGSNLHKLYRAKISNSPALLAQAKDYVQTALQWLITDGIAASITVTTAYLAPGAISIGIMITKPTGKNAQMQFAWNPAIAA